MMAKVTVKGVDTVVRNLQREISAIKGRTREGMSFVGLQIQESAMSITPWEFGTLANSAFSVTTFPNVEPIVTTVGYTASYAPFVHEMPETTRWTKPGTGPKFLERAVSRESRSVLATLQRYAQVPNA